MAKKIPKKLDIGRKRYKVKKVRALTLFRMGEINHRTQELRLAKVLNTALFGLPIRITTKQQWETFWHEAVHGILHDMKREDLNNERFVNAFCKRLYQALRSK